MVVIPGIITAAAKTSIKAIVTVVKCSNCGHEKILQHPKGFGFVDTPRMCDNA